MVGSIGDLPLYILENIGVRVAKVCGVDALYLGMVNKAFKAMYEHPSVLRESSLEILPLNPAFRPEDRPGFRKWMKKLSVAGNQEALYRRRLEHYFDEPRRMTKRRKELGELTCAASGGYRRAQHILGLILVCKGGEQKAEGYGYLAHLMRPRLSQTIEEVWGMRLTLKSAVICRSGATAAERLSAYSRSACECGPTVESTNQTMEYLKLVYSYGDQWYLTEDDHEETPPICLICFWYSEIVLHFSNDPQAFDDRI